jgi:hypothetical protein
MKTTGYKSFPALDAWLARQRTKPATEPTPPPPSPEQEPLFKEGLPLSFRVTWKKKLLAEYRSRR